ncbi:MAG: hypothetical protein V3R51_07485, partial [Gammaproteobacteria bacterium]
MSPVVRILCLVIFAACIARAEFLGLVVGFGLLALVSVFNGNGAWTGLVVMLRRVRWLLISLLVIYGWFTPGPELLPVLGSLSPSVRGLYEGSLRITALLVMVAAVHLLLRATVREQLLSALHQLTAPLTWLRFPRERFVARMMLVLDAVPQMQELVDLQLAALSRTGSVWERMAKGTRVIYDAVLAKAEQQPTE